MRARACTVTDRFAKNAPHYNTLSCPRHPSLIGANGTFPFPTGSPLVLRSLLSRDQQIGLKHVKDFEARIPRAEVEALEKVVQAAAAAHDPPLEMTVCGSYRRGRSESGDIDCLLSHPSFVHAGGGDATWPGWIASMVRGLEKEGFLTDVISQGVKKCHAVCRLPVAADSSHAASPAVALTATAGVSTDQADAAATPGPGAPGGAAPQLPRWQDVLAKKRAGAAHAQLNMFSAWQAAKAPAPTDRDGETSGGKSGHTDGDAESGTSNGSTSSVGGKQRAAIVSSDRDTPGLALGDAFGPKGALDFGAHDESAEGQRRYRRIDLRLVPYENYFGHVLYFTGSAESNKQMRNVAIEKGFKLSEYGLFRIGEDGKEAERPESVSSEKDYFTLLGLPYKSPSERDI